MELVSRGWQCTVARYQLWRRLILRCVANDTVWQSLVERRGWLAVINLTEPLMLPACLEQRRTHLGLRQRLSDFPLLKASDRQILPIASTSSSRDSGVALPSQGYGDNWVPATGVSSASELERHEAMMFANRFYKQLYPRIIRDIKVSYGVECNILI